MAQGNGHKFISADGHVQEPSNLWVERMERRFRDRAPRIVTKTYSYGNHEQFDAFQIDGLNSVDFIDTIATMANEKAAGTPIEGHSHNRIADVRPGAADPIARLADQDLDNIRAEVIYPNCAMYILAAPDVEYRRECIRVYNDFLAEFCAAAPQRLVGVGILPIGGPIEWAIEESERMAKMNLKSVLLPADTPNRPWWDPYYVPLWEALSSLGLPVAFHNTATEQFLSPTEKAAGISLAMRVGNYGIVETKIGNQMRSLTCLLGSAVPQRYPNLQFVIAEGGIGWVAPVIRLMDHWWEDHHHYMEPKLDEPPSFYCHRQCWFTVEDDRAGLLTRELLNVDRLMWGSDYPHTEGTFPGSRQRVEKDFAGIPDTERLRITSGNAARLYGI